MIIVNYLQIGFDLQQSDKILKLMNLPLKKDDPNDYFEQMKDQVLTYDLLEEDIPKIVFSAPKISNSERHKLQLPKKDEGTSAKEPDWKDINRNIKKITSALGKIIPVGSAIFKSNFQCGNISNVVLTGPNTYQIDLEKQTNSNRVSNWFYFSVEGVKGEANFIIKGFTKSSSLYNEGMKICYREISQVSKWRRGGTKISYTNSIEDDEYKSTFELRFSFFFKSNEPTSIQFACCFPYGLKRLYSLINQIKHSATYSVLCKTFNGLDLPLLTIGNAESKEVIVISARVHPGETVSSFIAQGFLKQLTAQGELGSVLRQNFLFKVVPMLNPDGVIKGNYRFSGYGCDLNRKWKVCRQSNQPEVFYMRELIKSCNKDKKVIMYVDIHGHSRQKNVFFYGCYEGNQSQDPNSNLKPMQFPYLMEKLSEAYKFENCSFSIGKDKEGTARVTMWRELKIDYVYTLQASFCGPQYGANYLESDYEKVGKKLCEGIAVLFNQKLTKQSALGSKGLQRLLRVKQKAFAELKEHPELLFAKKEDQVGSESEPDAGEIADKDRNPETGLPKPDLVFRHVKKPQKTRKNLIPSFNTYNFVSVKQDKPSLRSESSFRDRLNTNRKTEINTEIDEMNEQQDSRRAKASQFQVQLGDFLNLVEMPQNKSAEMHQQRNIRLYSLNRNGDKHIGKDFRHHPSTQFCRDQPRPEPPQSKTSHRESLLHGREGAQYRRVRKLAEQSYRKEQSIQVVQQLQGSQLYMSKTDGSRANAIAPRFYPISQQKSRRVSVENYLRKNREEMGRNAHRREVSFKCTGTEIGKYKSDR